MTRGRSWGYRELPLPPFGLCEHRRCPSIYARSRVFVDAATEFGESDDVGGGSKMSEIGTNRVRIDTDWTKVESAMMQDVSDIMQDDPDIAREAAALRKYGPDLMQVVSAVRKLDAAVRQDVAAMRKVEAAIVQDGPAGMQGGLAGTQDVAAMRKIVSDIWHSEQSILWRNCRSWFAAASGAFDDNPGF